MKPGLETLGDLQAWCSAAPEGTRLEASQVAEMLEQVADSDPEPAPMPVSREPGEPSWRERLWTAPSECRIGVEELKEALGVSESWIYRRTQQEADPRLPHSKLGGSLVFRCGEIRAWLRDQEQVEAAYRSEPAVGELRVQDGGGV